MKALLAFFFPRTLRRLSYCVRLVITNVAFFWIALGMDLDEPTQWAALAPLGIYTALFVLLPRIRDLQVSPWLLVIAFIPYASGLLGLILLFRRGGPRLGASSAHARHVEEPSSQDDPISPS